MRTALTIAGSDSGGGAGVQADLKTFAAHGVYGLSAITAVTAQNTERVSAVLPLPPEIITAQIDAVAADFGAAATKIGMLANSAIARAVADAITRWQLPNVVLDTVILAKSGDRLLDDEAVAVLLDMLMPLSAIVTPNLPEAERLTGRRVTTIAQMREAAAWLVAHGARAVVVKGGHLDGPVIDVLHDGHDIVELASGRVTSRHTHGTGCTFSAAIAAELALGLNLRTAVERAKAYVAKAITNAPGLGRGHGPVQHFP